MIRFTANRAVADWINRSRSRKEAEQAEAEGLPPVPGVVMRTRFQVVYELDHRLAANLLKHIDDALSNDLHEAKRGAIELARRQLLEHFPDLG